MTTVAERTRSEPTNREVALRRACGLVERASGGIAVIAFIGYSRVPRPVQLHRIEPHLHAVTIGTGRKQRQLAVPLAAFTKGVDQLAAGMAQAITDLCSALRSPKAPIRSSVALIWKYRS